MTAAQAFLFSEPTYSVLRKRDGWQRGPCAYSDAASLVRRLHYSKGCANTAVLTAGLWTPAGRLVGAAMWMPCIRGAEAWAQDTYGCSQPVTLSRMAIEDSVPRNGASFLLAGCYPLLSAKGYDLAVTWADPLEGHDGHVYRAAGWEPAGHGVAEPRWRDPSGRLRSRKVGNEWSKDAEGRAVRTTRNYTAAEMRAMGWTRVVPPPPPRFVRRLEVK